MKSRLRILPAVFIYGALAAPVAADIAESFSRALVSTERSPEIQPDEDIYVGLLGMWDVDARDRAEDGSYKSTRGEWIFVRTLEGRAVQDVWIAPVRAERTVDTNRFANRYGTSLRMFDPNTRRWQVTWFNPVTGAFDVLVARQDGSRIVHEGTRRSGQQIRWTFHEITKTTFRWTGEAARPDGSWELDAEFSGKRRR